MTRVASLSRRATISSERVARATGVVLAIADASAYAVGFDTVEENCVIAEKALGRLARTLAAEKAAVKVAPGKANAENFNAVVEKMEEYCGEIAALVHDIRGGCTPNITAAEMWSEVSGACDGIRSLVPAYAAALSGAGQDRPVRH